MSFRNAIMLPNTLMICMACSSSSLSSNPKEQSDYNIDNNGTRNSYDASSYKLSSVVLADSVGVWEQEEEYGYFKVIVYREGLEHSQDKVRVLITKAQPNSNNQEIINDFVLNSPGVKGHINHIALEIVNNQLVLGLDISMKAMDGITLREVMLIKANGTVTELSTANHSDLYD